MASTSRKCTTDCNKFKQKPSVDRWTNPTKNNLQYLSHSVLLIAQIFTEHKGFEDSKLFLKKEGKCTHLVHAHEVVD